MVSFLGPYGWVMLNPAYTTGWEENMIDMVNMIDMIDIISVTHLISSDS